MLTYAIWGITAGICVATVYLYFIKKICGDFFKALTENQCIGEENAKSAEELGIKQPSGYLEKQLSPKGGMYSMVKTTADKKYYIPEEKVLMAGKKYRAEQLPFIAVIGIVIVVIAIGALAAHFAPIITDSLGELF